MRLIQQPRRDLKLWYYDQNCISDSNHT
jgi:hypothetical protein